MNILWLVLIIPAMHLLGSCVLAAFVLGPSMAYGGIVLSIFGWYCLPLEAIGASLIFRFYNPDLQQNKTHTLKIGLSIGLLGAVIFAPMIPKEQGSELSNWLGSILAGFTSMVFAFTCIHIIKLKNQKKM